MEMPRFLVAKYIPDVFRNEPRNIGVILWTEDGILTKFAGDSPDAPDQLDEAAIPSFVSSPEAYRQWVRYWRREASKPSIRPATGGASVPRTSPACLDALRQTGPGNFVLADGGVIDELLPAAILPGVISELFTDYVSSQISPEVQTSENEPEGAAVGRAAKPRETARTLPITGPPVRSPVTRPREREVPIRPKAINSKAEEKSTATRTRTPTSGIKPHAAARKVPRLVLGSRSAFAELMAEALRARGWDVHSTGSEDLVEVMTRKNAAAVVIPVSASTESGFLTAAKIRIAKPKVKVVLVGERTKHAERLARFVGAEFAAEADGVGGLLTAFARG